LERVRTTEAQFGLSPLERSQNLQDAFKVGKGLSPHRGSAQILLVDDIYTTGATARAAVETLQQSGIKVLGMVVVAKAEQSKHSRITN
jgi:predicted amidophosphoribosyltransferase